MRRRPVAGSGHHAPRGGAEPARRTGAADPAQAGSTDQPATVAVCRSGGFAGTTKTGTVATFGGSRRKNAPRSSSPCRCSRYRFSRRSVASVSLSARILVEDGRAAGVEGAWIHPDGRTADGFEIAIYDLMGQALGMPVGPASGIATIRLKI